jgi:catechol 2,3-dioxygenase-like lactoylglutathione lyase family enzyme
MNAMTSLEYVTLEVDDLAAAERFYAAAFGLGPRVRLRASEPPTSGFRAFTLSLVVSPRPRSTRSSGPRSTPAPRP